MEILSPNFNERDPAVSLDYIVLHYTGMKTGAEALQRLCDPASQVSAHYMIEEDGRVFHLVDESKRAWHAGKSSWRGVSDMNSASVGIELVNPGHEFGYRTFPGAQIFALKELMFEIIERHGMSPTVAPVAHSDISIGRKEDPGELFPWEELAREGLGVWPVSASHVIASAAKQSRIGSAALDESELRNLLHRIGYNCSLPLEGRAGEGGDKLGKQVSESESLYQADAPPPCPSPQGGGDASGNSRSELPVVCITEKNEPSLHEVLLAFQRHYQPHNLTGIADQETVARLQALAI